MKQISLAASLTSLVFATYLQAETVTLPWQGLTLTANLQQSEDSSPGSPTFLITHGTLAHNGMELIANLQEALADEGYDSLAINLSLGISNRTGMYDCSHPHQHSHDDAIAELEQWSRWLQQRSQSPVYTVGHSRGGNQTALFSAGDSTVQGQILLAPMTWDAAEAAKNYQQRYGKALEPVLQTALTSADGHWLEHTDFIYCKDSRVKASSFVSYYQDDPRRDTPSFLKNTQLPTLVISGSEDKTVPGLAKRMANISNENVQHAEIEGADHYFRDLYLDDVVEQMIEFVDAS